MKPAWLKVNEKVHNGIALINSTSTTNFTLLLQQITGEKNENMFLEEELLKLEESLNLSRKNLQVLLQTVVYIFRQSSKIILKPTDLQKDLTDVLKMDEEKAKEFVKVWASEVKQDFSNLENRTFLDRMTWHVTLQANSSDRGRDLKPKAVIQFGVNDINNAHVNNINFELYEEELVHVYNCLENIQVKLDSL